MNTFEMAFESNCNYDEAIVYFNERITSLPQIKETIGKPKVFKDGEYWKITQEVDFTFRAKLRMFYLKYLNKITG